MQGSGLRCLSCFFFALGNHQTVFAVEYELKLIHNPIDDYDNWIALSVLSQMLSIHSLSKI